MQLINLEDWQPFSEAWSQFTKAKPSLGLSDSRFAIGRFLSVHSDVMEASGVIARGPHGRTHAHREFIDDAIWRLVHGQELPDYTKSVTQPTE